MQLSANFSLEELSFSSTGQRHGIDNTAPPAIVGELTRLCTDVLEPARAILGAPLHVDSGYRCPAINALVKGNPNSQHMLGQAADVIPQNVSLRDAFDQLRASASLPYDQIILECGTWIHLSCAHDGAVPRRMMLDGELVNGEWVYTEVTP